MVQEQPCLLCVGQAVYLAPVEAEGFFISKGRGRDTAFYKKVLPFERSKKAIEMAYFRDFFSLYLVSKQAMAYLITIVTD